MFDLKTPRFAWWKRLVLLALTAVVVVGIYRKLEWSEFVVVLRRLRPEWALAGVLLYGVVLLCAIGRWHLAMRVTETTVHLAASARATLIGHFFTVALFSGSVADLAKSMLYARWHRYTFPVVFAGAKIDRILGFVGILLLWLVALIIAVANDALDRPAGFGLNLPAWWKLLAGAFVVVGVFYMLCQNRAFKEGLARFVEALFAGLKRLLHRPGVAGAGVGFGVLVQGGLSFVLALNLQAITGDELDWAKLLWLFPIIQLVSTLPITIAGLGLREMAAILLLGWYGVTEEEAAAAALMTLATTVLWAGAGGVVLWREMHRLRKVEERPVPATISVVIPTLDEATELPATLESLKRVREVREVIVVDGGSADDTVALAGAAGAHVIQARPGRGGQMRRGAESAAGEVVLFLHADTRVTPQVGGAVLNAFRDPLVVGGGCWKTFRTPFNPLLLGSVWRCGLRLYAGKWIAGDQGLFVRRDVLESIGGFPEMELMEEFRLCELLRREGRLALACDTVTTSARRFEKFGVLRTYWKMWRIVFHYRRGMPPAELRKLYER